DENLLKVLQMQVAEPLPPPRSINPALSPAIAATLERALAKDPAARHASINALLVDLEAAVPPGSDRLLIEAQTGGASSFRINAITGPALRLVDSQQLARVGSQPLPRHASEPLPGRASQPLPAAPSSSTVPDLSTSGKRMWWLAAVPALGVLALGAWLVLHDAPTALPRPPSEVRAIGEARRGAASEPRSAVAPAAATMAAASPDAAPMAAASPDAAPPPAMIRVQLATTPPGATVELDGKRYGETPIDIELPRQDGDAQLVISRDGFADLKQRLDLRADRSLSLALTRTVRP